MSLVAFWTWQDLLRDCEGGGGSRNPELPLGLGTEDWNRCWCRNAHPPITCMKSNSPSNAILTSPCSPVNISSENFTLLFSTDLLTAYNMFL